MAFVLQLNSGMLATMSKAGRGAIFAGRVVKAPLRPGWSVELHGWQLGALPVCFLLLLPLHLALASKGSLQSCMFLHATAPYVPYTFSFVILAGYFLSTPTSFDYFHLLYMLNNSENSMLTACALSARLCVCRSSCRVTVQVTAL